MAAVAAFSSPINAVVLPFCLAAMTSWSCTSREPSAALWFAPGAVVLPASLATQIGGPLTDAETAAIERASRSELDHAFSGFALAIGERPDAFWQVRVVHDIERNFPTALPVAGRSMAFGPFGGAGAVDATMVAFAALRYAPVAAARTTVLEGIGRGIGRVAAHELGHQILGPAAADEERDQNSYEYGSPERAAQYYGELRWTRWRAPLQARLGGGPSVTRRGQ